MIRCSACGATLILSGKNSPCPSLQCHNYAKGKCSTSHALSLRKANAAVLAGLQDAVDRLDFDMVPRRSAPVKSAATVDYGRLLEQERRKLSRCRDAYQSGVDTLDEYRENKARLESNIRRLEEQAAAIVSAPKDFDKAAYAKKVASVIRYLQTDADEAAKSEALRSVVDHITFHKASQHLAIYFYV